MKTKSFTFLCLCFLLLPFAAEAQNGYNPPKTDSLSTDSLNLPEDSIPIRPYQSFFGNISTSYDVFWPADCWTNDDNVTPNPQLLGCGETWDYHIRSEDTVRMDGNLYYPLSGGYCREDTTSGQLFFLINGTETMVCDMSLQRGDTFSIPLLRAGSTSPLIVADTVFYTPDNRKRIDFHCVANPNTGTIIPNNISYSSTEILNIKMSFIEGIGPIYSPIGGFDAFSREMTILLCVKKDDTLAYMTDERLGCYQFGGDVKDVDKEVAILLYPNPARTQINVKISEWQGGGTLYVLNAMGLVVASRPISEQEFTLNVSHLANGFYTIVATDDKGRRSFAKFVKEE